MTQFIRKIVALTATMSVFFLSAAPAVAAPGGATLEGLVQDLDGRPAAGYRVHLIGDQGEALGTAGVDGEGMYSFGDLEAGKYALGVENATGQMAPVTGPAIKLEGRQLARRDVKLMRGNGEFRDEAFQGNHGLGQWWASLTTAAKTWTIIGVVTVIGITVAATDDDDSDEPVASAYEPEN
ncbi:MAG: carboxypeptidase regulatory-like domain-containing protein [bacterium]|nr:carboxypeptidase regulatory-like domain-containing protein [bacterium]